MELVPLGNSGLIVSRIGFGGLPIQSLDQKDAIIAIRRCLELGVTLIDSARDYTVSEEYIGKAISSFSRDKLVIATKTTAHKYQEAKEDIRESLKKLNTSYIDLYQLHNISNENALHRVMSDEGSFSALREAKKAGIIQHIGISSHNPDTAKAAVRLGTFETMMYPFNFVAYEPGEEVLGVCREYGVGFMAMKPMAGGQLGNAALAFRYLLNIPGVIPVVGIERPSEIEEIITIEKKLERLSRKDFIQIEKIRKELGTRFCRRCRYCMPCAEGIFIPLMTNLVAYLNHSNPASFFGAGTLEAAIEKARLCAECGECEKRCPYDLPIIEIIRENIAIYDEAKARYEKGQR